MKYCFLTDKGSDYFNHTGEDYPNWYLIPLEKRTEFFKLLTGYALDIVTREYVDSIIIKYRIGDIDILENYSFENPEEI